MCLKLTHRTIDNDGRQAIDIESGGKGLLFQAGIVKEIEWENIDGILTPMENGVPAKLVPGKTWIHIVPTKPGIDINCFLYPLKNTLREREKYAIDKIRGHQTDQLFKAMLELKDH